VYAVSADIPGDGGLIVNDQQRPVAARHRQNLSTQAFHFFGRGVLFPQLYHGGPTSHGSLYGVNKALTWNQMRIGNHIQTA
jgi:hypothetical protein